MTTLQTFVRRDDLGELSPMTTHLLIALLSIAIVAVIAATALFVVRHMRIRRAALAQLSLPTHSKEASLSRESLAPPPSSPPTQRRQSQSRRGHGHGHRRTISVTAVPSPHDLVPMSHSSHQKRDATSQAHTVVTTVSGPLPQIHITFPDEDRDVNEKRHSGRVVVVRVSENGCLGLAPYDEDKQSPTNPGPGAEFMSLELERLGGLREKGDRQWA